MFRLGSRSPRSLRGASFFCFFLFFAQQRRETERKRTLEGDNLFTSAAFLHSFSSRFWMFALMGGGPPKSISRDHSIHSDQCEIIHKKIQTASQERSSNMQKRIHRRRQLWALRSRWINIYWILSHVSACLQHSAIMQIRYTNVKSLWSSSFTFTK